MFCPWPFEGEYRDSLLLLLLVWCSWPGDGIPVLLLLLLITGGLEGDIKLVSMDDVLMSRIILCVRLTWPSGELVNESSCGDGIMCWSQPSGDGSWDGLKLPMTGVSGAELSAGRGGKDGY